VTLRTAAVLAGVLSLSLPSAAPSATPLPGIRSPSRNISCLLLPRRPQLLCRIGRASYAAALQRSCSSPPTGLDWHGFELDSAGKARAVCSGGILYDPATERPAYVTLPYGHSWRRSIFTCLSRLTGITCRSDSGHGLFVSRASWRAW
jgi:hypothetical protein